MSDIDIDAKEQQLADRLAQHGLNPPATDLPGMAPMIAEIATASNGLRRERPFSLEPLNTFSLARTGAKKK